MRSSWSLLLVALFGVLGACAQTRTHLDVPAAQQWATTDEQLDFFDDLAAQPIVTNDDALHALLLHRQGTSEATYDERVAIAIDLGWIATSPGDAGASTQVGMVASIAARSPAIEPGLALDLANDAPWKPGGFLGLAATKRLRALDMLPPRSPEQALTGGELLALLRRLELYESVHAGAVEPLP